MNHLVLKIVEQDINGTHYYSIATGNNNTHDNIIITSTNKEKTQKMYESIKYHQNKNSSNNTATVEHINNDTPKQTTNNSKKIPDGYELSPQSGKYIKTVKDENGEIRQYDLNGNLVGSSHESDQAYLREKSIAETGTWPGD